MKIKLNDNQRATLLNLCKVCQLPQNTFLSDGETLAEKIVSNEQVDIMNPFEPSSITKNYIHWLEMCMMILPEKLWKLAIDNKQSDKLYYFQRDNGLNEVGQKFHTLSDIRVYMAGLIGVLDSIDLLNQFYNQASFIPETEWHLGGLLSPEMNEQKIIKKETAKTISQDLISVKPMTEDEHAAGRPKAVYPYKYNWFENSQKLKDYLVEALRNPNLDKNNLIVNQVVYHPFNDRKDIYFVPFQLYQISCPTPLKDNNRWTATNTLCELHLNAYSLKGLQNIIEQIKNEI